MTARGFDIDSIRARADEGGLSRVKESLEKLAAVDGHLTIEQYQERPSLEDRVREAITSELLGVELGPNVSSLDEIVAAVVRAVEN